MHFDTGREPWVTKDRCLPDFLVKDLKNFDDKLEAQWWNIIPTGRPNKCFRLVRKENNRYYHVMWFDMHPGQEQRLIDFLRQEDLFKGELNLHNKKETYVKIITDLQKRIDKDELLGMKRAKDLASDMVDDAGKDKTGILYSYRK